METQYLGLKFFDWYSNAALLTVRAKVNGTVGNGAPLVVGDAHGKVVPINQ